MKNKYWSVLFCVIIVALGLNSCFNEKLRTGADTFVKFSKDTLTFDTVFTSVGSATRSFKIYNPYDETVVLSKVSLRNQTNGSFRLNIDGLTGNLNEAIELLPNDSIYVFVEVTVNPDNPVSVSPFVIEDYVDIEVNGNQQNVLLQAFGQNANYIPLSKDKNGAVSLCSDFNTVVFDDPKPYVVYGILVIDSCNLVVPEGTQIYVHGGLANSSEGNLYTAGIIAVNSTGSIDINGTVDNPVVIQGDRLEESYSDVPGQWTGLIALSGCDQFTMEHTIIKNSILGVRVDSAASVRISNTIFSNQASSAIAGYHAEEVDLDNCLFERSGGNALNLAYGGDYSLNYCTIEGFNSSGAALGASNYVCRNDDCTEQSINPMNLNVTNSILVGIKKDQIVLVNRAEASSFNYEFKNCLVRVDELLDSEKFVDFYDHCTDCLTYAMTDTLFLNPAEFDFHLDTLSKVEGKGIPISNIPFDLEGNIRDVDTPDIGCYEYQY